MLNKLQTKAQHHISNESCIGIQETFVRGDVGDIIKLAVVVVAVVDVVFVDMEL